MKLGLSRNYANVSLFPLETATIRRDVKDRYPRAASGAIAAEACSIIAAILGVVGLVYLTPDDDCLCAFYSHTSIDPELIAAQVSRTLHRAVSMSDPAKLSSGPFLSVKLTDHGAEQTIRSFLDGE